MPLDSSESKTSIESNNGLLVEGKLDENMANDGSLVSSPDSVHDDPSFSDQNQTFFVGYSYMQTLSQQALDIKSRGPKFLCHLCTCYFHTRLSMITHMKMHRTPFCPVCFLLCYSASDVNHHISASHPEIAQDDDQALQEEEVLCMEESSYIETDAPPNSPIHIDEAKQGKSENIFDANNNNENNSCNTISELLEEKLLEHQLTEQADSGEQAMGSLRHLRINEKKSSSIIGSWGKVLKSPRTKAAMKLVGNVKEKAILMSEGPDENIMKVTSRFGRSISLKVPQF